MRRRKRLIKIITIIIACTLISSGTTFYYFGIYQKNKLINSHNKEIETYKIDLNASCYQINKDVKKNSKVKISDLKKVRIPSELKNKSIVSNKNKTKNSFYANDYEAGCILYKNMIYDYDNLASDLRQYEISSLLLPSGIEIGNYIDVRISFPSGLDYVVLAKKKIRSINQDEKADNKELSTLYLNSEEILRLSSAMVDSYINGDVKLYSTVYLDPQTQKASNVTYPSNPQVEKLMKEDANVVQKAKNSIANRAEINSSLEEPLEPITAPINSVKIDSNALPDENSTTQIDINSENSSPQGEDHSSTIEDNKPTEAISNQEINIEEMEIPTNEIE